MIFQNIQNYNKNSSSQINSQNYSSIPDSNLINSATNSTNSNSQSSVSKFNSANLSTNFMISESQNPDFINNFINSQPENSKVLNSSNKTEEINQNSQNLNQETLYFNGKIGDLSIRMVLNIVPNNAQIADSAFVNYYQGSYIYESKSDEKISLFCEIIRSEQVARLDNNLKFEGKGK